MAKYSNVKHPKSELVIVFFESHCQSLRKGVCGFFLPPSPRFLFSLLARMEEVGQLEEDLLQAEGTVLLHVDHFIKHSEVLL